MNCILLIIAFRESSFDSCMEHALEGSAVLLYEDGVYAAIKGRCGGRKVKMAQGEILCFGPRSESRGLSDERVTDGIEIVDYAGFVDLAAEHDKVVAWV